MLVNSTLLRINVGFIVNQANGFSREFQFEILELSFGDDLEIQNLEVKIDVSRTTEGLLVQVNGQAHTGLECVYCLDVFKKNLRLDFVEMYIFPSHAVEDTELILPEDFQINLSPLMREYLLLDIPINPVCKTDCQGLCPICGIKVQDVKCNHTTKTIDPRLSKLQSLIDDQGSAAQ